MGASETAIIRQPLPDEERQSDDLVSISDLQTVGQCCYYAPGNGKHVKVPAQLFEYEDGFTVAVERKEAKKYNIRLCYFEFGNSEDDTHGDKDVKTQVATRMRSQRSHGVIWFRVKQEFIRILNHLRKAEGEKANLQHRPQRGNTDTRNLMLELIDRELD